MARGGSRASTNESAEAHSLGPCRAVYIHGIGPQPRPDIWKSQWDITLFGMPMSERTCGFYWADIVYGTAKGASTAATMDDEVESIERLMDAIGLNPSNQSAFEFMTRLVARLDTFNAETSDAMSSRAMTLPRRRSRGIADPILRGLVLEAAAYFFNPATREKIKSRLIGQLRKMAAPYAIVAHGTGAIIAYDVLSRMTRKDLTSIAVLVTLGSPLGMKEIQDELGRSRLSIVVPPGLISWQNFADRFDPIAFENRLAGDFIAGSNDSEIQDHWIINRSLWSPGSINPHDSANYLTHPEVRGVVHQVMRFDSAGRFVVARDVAHGFAARDKRQPVLIEVLEPNYPAVGENEKDRVEREEKQRQERKGLSKLPRRIQHLATAVKNVVREFAERGKENASVEAARVQCLRKYVAANLTPVEIHALADDHANLNIYAMWRSSAKKKLIHRSHAVMSADAARVSFKSRGQGITWAVLDTGCRSDHPHFLRKPKGSPPGQASSLVKLVLDCTTNSSRPEPIKEYSRQDVDGHGTHVCGIISGRSSEDGIVYSGIAPAARLIVYKVLNDHGVGEDAWIIKAIDDIFRRNENGYGIAVHGVNLSLGGPFDPTVYGCGASPLCQMLRDIWRQGTLVCCAAGNEGQIQVSTKEGYFDLNTSLSIGDPANLQECIAVGAVHTDKPYLYGVSYFSSRGPTADGRIKPDVVAPGERISSCSNDFNGKKYRVASGTSMACPHVSGLLASFLSVRREFIGRPDEVKEILLRNCNDLGRDRRHQGHGIPNLLKMLTET